MKISLYIVYLIAAVLGIIYLAFWLPFVSDLRESKSTNYVRVRHVDQQTYFQLGSIITGDDLKFSHFTHFNKRKPSNTVRICSLGDSHTFGDETGSVHDYPSYMQRLFETAGITNVQVINFGNTWYGFSQTMYMWEAVASKFNCDFVLLMPFAFWCDRDTTFNHTNLQYPNYLHARYIIDGEQIKLLPVLGNTVTERFEAYYRFIPKWAYLRYDRSAPFLIHALLGRGRTVNNWFYYEPRTASDECEVLYERMANQLADSAEQLIIGLFWLSDEFDTINKPMNRVQRSNVSIISASLPRLKFPYHSGVEHYSAWTNELLAKLYFASLTGSDEGSLSTLEIEEYRSVENKRNDAVPLQDYDSIVLAIAGHVIGTINPVDKGLARKTKGKFHASLKNSGVVSLLALKSQEVGLSDACLVPLDHSPKQGETLEVRSIDKDLSVNLGKIYYPNKHINIAVASANLRNLTCSNNGFKFRYRTANKSIPLTESDIQLLLGKKVIITGEWVNQSFTFHKDGYTPYKFRANGDYLANIAKLDSSGIIEVKMQSGESNTVEPLFMWKIISEGLTYRQTGLLSRKIVIKDAKAFVQNNVH